MIKVKDVDGKELSGVYRSKYGSLVVNNETMLLKYKMEQTMKKKDKETIESLKTEIETLKDMVNKLIERIK